MPVDNIASLARVDYDEKHQAILEVHKEHPYETVIKVKNAPDIKQIEGHGVIALVTQEGQVLKRRSEMDDARAEGWDALLVRPIKAGKQRQYFLARFGETETAKTKGKTERSAKEGYLQEPSEEAPLYVKPAS